MVYKKFIFIGNREFVLNEMIKNNLKIIKALVVKNSYLEKIIKSKGVEYEIFDSKKELLEMLNELDYDVLVSNGCPYVLPIKKMKPALYVNIHPSLLPDLRGKDPVVGAILFSRTSGATCHIMNEEIDDGDIISQIDIPVTDDVDVTLLYQLCFFAEAEVFLKALKNKFIPIKKQYLNDNCIYYSAKENDKIITFKEDNRTLIRKINAFSNKSQGCMFLYRGSEFKVYRASIVNNAYIDKISLGFANLSVIFKFERDIIFKKDKEIVRFYEIQGDISKIEINTLIK